MKCSIKMASRSSILYLIMVLVECNEISSKLQRKIIGKDIKLTKSFFWGKALFTVPSTLT